MNWNDSSKANAITISEISIQIEFFFDRIFIFFDGSVKKQCKDIILFFMSVIFFIKFNIKNEIKVGFNRK